MSEHLIIVSDKTSHVPTGLSGWVSANAVVAVAKGDGRSQVDIIHLSMNNNPVYLLGSSLVVKEETSGDELFPLFSPEVSWLVKGITSTDESLPFTASSGLFTERWIHQHPGCFWLWLR